MEWKKSQKTDGDGDTAGGAWTPGNILELGEELEMIHFSGEH